jgi:hypothetical protein
MELLTDSAHQAIEQHSDFYTWVSQNGHKEEVDGLTILALILACVCPNFRVDMYTEITKVKKLTVAQYDNDIQLSFGASSFSSFILIKRILPYTLRMPSFGISFSN